MFQSSMQ